MKILGYIAIGFFLCLAMQKTRKPAQPKIEVFDSDGRKLS